MTETVAALTGTPAETFETTARRYTALPFAQATPANRLRAILDVAITPLVPGYDLARLGTQLGIPPSPASHVRER